MSSKRHMVLRVFTLEERQHILSDALKALGPGWHGRQAIAVYLSKNKLNPVEVAVLDFLAAAGQVERRMQPTEEQPHISRWVYRVKE
jgi:hypothetical protein